VLKPRGVIFGTILDAYRTSNPVDLAYHQRNRDLGRMPGQLTMRVRYENMASAWFDGLAATPAETVEVAAGRKSPEASPASLRGGSAPSRNGHLAPRSRTRPGGRSPAGNGYACLRDCPLSLRYRTLDTASIEPLQRV
jgi:hypothetical protein